MAEKTRVLIVDDDTSYADSLSDILTEKGYETIVANSVNVIPQKIKEIHFEVILLDIKMPIMNGVDAYKMIKGISSQIPVIMMTAFSVENLIRAAFKEGAYGILYKPLDIDRLVNMIESAKRGECLAMVVDNDPNTWQTLKDILEAEGYAVILVGDGEDAINIAKERLPDIIFIDMNLPVLNGLQTYLAIRELNPKIVAVMMSAYGQERKDLIEQALKEGAYTCLYKPFDPKEAADIVRDTGKKIK